MLLNDESTIFKSLHARKSCFVSLIKYLQLPYNKYDNKIFDEEYIDYICDYLNNNNDNTITLISYKKWKKLENINNNNISDLSKLMIIHANNNLIPRVPSLYFFNKQSDILEHLNSLLYTIKKITIMKGSDDIVIDYCNLMLEYFILSGKYFFKLLISMYPTNIKLKKWNKIIRNKEYMVYNNIYAFSKKYIYAASRNRIICMQFYIKIYINICSEFYVDNEDSFINLINTITT